MIFQKLGVQTVLLIKMDQQTVEQRRIGTGFERQMRFGDIAGGGAARVDHHQLGLAGTALPRGEDALIQHRMAPGQIGADQHNHVGFFQVLVTTGHGIRAERPLVAGHRGRHAQPRVGVDVGTTEATFHQLVGDVVILGQQLPGDVKSDGIRTVLRQCLAKTGGDCVQCFVPRHAPPGDLGIQQAIIQAQRFAQRRAFRAKPPIIGRMLLVACHTNATVGIDRDFDPAADSTIGASGANCFASAAHRRILPFRPLPAT